MVRFDHRLLRVVALGLIAGGLLTTGSGCQALFATVAYMAGAADTPASYPGDLREKRVAIVVRPVASLEYSSKRPAAELAAELTRQLQNHHDLRKVKFIKQEEVKDWCDEHEWEEFPEVGKALTADVVIAVELETFGLYQSQTLYRGTADFTLTVHHLTGEDKSPWEMRPTGPMTFPSNSGIYTQDKTEPEFRRMFVAALAEQLARNFYAHDLRDDWAKDSLTIK